MTIRLSPDELKVIVAEFVLKTIPSAAGYPVVVKFIEVYGDGSGEGEIDNLSRVDASFGKEAQNKLLQKTLQPLPDVFDVRPGQIDCLCWATGRYVWVEGCPSHPRESAT